MLHGGAKIEEHDYRKYSSAEIRARLENCWAHSRSAGCSAYDAKGFVRIEQVRVYPPTQKTTGSARG
jgi:hypothetical protein